MVEASKKLIEFIQWKSENWELWYSLCELNITGDIDKDKFTKITNQLLEIKQYEVLLSIIFRFDSEAFVANAVQKTIDRLLIYEIERDNLEVIIDFFIESLEESQELS